MGGYLLLPLGTAGDVLPFCALGRSLRARGHQVLVAANPCFAGMIAEAGLDFEPLGDVEEYRRLVDSSLFMSRTFGFGHLMRWSSAQLDRTYQIAAAHRRSTVLAHPLAVGARLAEERHGGRTATVLLSPAILESAPLSWLMRRAFRDQHLFLALFPEWFAARQPRWPKNLVYNGFPLYDGAGPELRAEGELVFTAGTGNLRARRFFRAAVEAARALGRKALLLTRHREQLPPLGDARHVEYAPLGRLLQGAAALVHHGGIGTSAAALAAGVPQLVTPFAHDQPDNAARLEALGVARQLDRLRGPKMAEALAQLLASPLVSAACQRTAARIAAAEPFAAAVSSLESQEAAA